MVDLKDLQEASFKGARFLIDTTTTTGGRKTVTHEFPNSDRRFVEDLGRYETIHTLTGFITGDNYFADRDILIQRLTEGGTGELVHPFYGSITVSAKPYTLNENLNSLGLARFQMLFEKAEANVFPRVATNNIATIDSLSVTALDNAKAGFLDKFNVSRLVPVNFKSAITKVTDMSEALNEQAKSILKTTDGFSLFDGAVGELVSGVTLNVFNSRKLIDDIVNVYDEFANMGETFENKFDLLTGMFDFGDNDVLIPQTTTKRVERLQNSQTINTYAQVNVLAQAYNIVTSLEFTREDEIKAIQGVLDQQFNKVINSNVIDDNTVASLKNLRVEVRRYLEQENVGAFRVSEIEAHPIPMSVLSYQYYGDTAKTQELINLNDTKEPMFVEGLIKVLV